MKIGNYVRTDNGVIAKVNKIIDCANGKDFEYIGQEYYLNSKNQIVISNDVYYKDDVVGCLGKVIKTSNELIDLIEEGDYVNGYFIEGNKGNYLETSDIDGEYSYLGHIEYRKIYERDIDTIVTKEQFESMEYKVVE